MRDIIDEARGRWPSILSNLGIDVGNGEHMPCPICKDGTDRFRFDDQDGSGSYYCNQCEPHAGFGVDLVMRSLGVEFKEAAAKIRSVLGNSEVCEPKDRCGDVAKNKRMLMDLWAKSRPIVDGDPVKLYLGNRGFDFNPDPAVLRFCPECYERETGSKMPAMIAVVKNSSGKTSTIHRTYLEKNDGKWVKCSSISKPKKFMPCVLPMRGCAIRLLPCNGEVGIAEGIETALACSKMFRVPTWAACSSTILQTFEPPSGVSHVHIFGDNDDNGAGHRAAAALSHKLVSERFKIDVKIPDQVGTDWWDWMPR